MTPGWLASRLATIREHEQRLTRLFGEDRGNGIGTGAWHPSTPEAAWNCVRDGHLPDEATCVYCQEEGA